MADMLSQVSGHSAVIENLRNAVKAKQLAPTLIFVGPSGVGKRKVALGLAQLLVCAKPVISKSGALNACTKCGQCVRIHNRQSEALLEIEPQGASIKIEQTRQVIKFISLAQSAEAARVVIFNDAHLLNPQAANSLLKSLEEPPPNTYFILVAPTASSVLPTLRSRSQIIRFGTLPRQTVADLSPDSPEWIVESSMGRLDLIEDLRKEEVTALRSAAFDFWQTYDSNALHDVLSSRESSLWVARFWLGLLRDSCFYQRGLKPLIHADQLPVIQNVAQKSEDAISQLAQDVYGLERDLRGNADYHLAFENFIRNQLHATSD
jgi:DNA polymerase III subunit delta'